MYFISQFLLRRSRKTVEILYITFFRISFYFYIPQILRALERESLCPSLWRAESRKFSHAYCLYPIYKDASCFILTPLLTNTLLHAFFSPEPALFFIFYFRILNLFYWSSPRMYVYILFYYDLDPLCVIYLFSSHSACSYPTYYYYFLLLKCRLFLYSQYIFLL